MAKTSVHQIPTAQYWLPLRLTRARVHYLNTLGRIDYLAAAIRNG